MQLFEAGKLPVCTDGRLSAGPLDLPAFLAQVTPSSNPSLPTTPHAPDRRHPASPPKSFCNHPELLFHPPKTFHRSSNFFQLFCISSPSSTPPSTLPPAHLPSCITLLRLCSTPPPLVFVTAQAYMIQTGPQHTNNLFFDLASQYQHDGSRTTAHLL